MRVSTSILLFSFLSANVAFGQPRDSLNIQTDSVLVLSPVGFRSDMIPMMFVPQFNNYLNTAIRDVWSIRKASGAKIRTDLSYELGLKKIQDFSFIHDQRIGEQSTVFVDYRRRTFDGFYTNEQYADNDVQAGIDWSDGKYAISCGVRYIDMVKNMNGGIANDSSFTVDELPPELIAVRNTNALASSSALVWHSGMYTLIGKNRLGLSFSGRKESWHYVDESPDNDTTYSNFLIDSTITNDGFNQGFETYGVAFISDSSDLKVEVLAGVSNLYYRNYSFSQEFAPSFRGALRYKSLNSGISATFGSGSNIRAYLGHITHLKKRNIRVDGRLYAGDPSPYYSRYSSNQLEWNAASNKVLNATGKLTYSDSALDAGATLGLIYNANVPIFEPDSGMYQISSTDQSALNLRLSKRLKFGSKWGSRLAYSFFTRLSGEQISYPPHLVSARVDKSGKLFKGKLRYKLDLGYTYNSSFYQYRIERTLFELYPQTDQQLRGYGFFDLRATAWIADMEFFLITRHLNQGLHGNTYFDFPHFPGKNLTISFGFKLYFTD